jgi:hypothetical protein
MQDAIERLNATGKWWVIGKGKVTSKEPLYACLIQEACIDGRVIARIEGDDLDDCVERALAKVSKTSASQ